MSSTVNMDMVLISTSNILPPNLLRAVFEESVKELDGTIQDNNLYLGKENLGKLTINSRIVLSFSTDFENSKRAQVRNLLRNTFTRRVSTAHDNYLFQLKREREKMAEQSRVELMLLESIKEIDKEIEKSEVGFERQQLSECDALKAEIVDAAIAQGYEVVEENTENGVQLQFIRREY